MEKKNLNDYIKKSHIKMVEELNAELVKFSEKLGSSTLELKEVNSSATYTLSPIKAEGFNLTFIAVENGRLVYVYKGKRKREEIVRKNKYTGEYFEYEYDGIVEAVKYFKKGLRVAKMEYSIRHMPQTVKTIQGHVPVMCGNTMTHVRTGKQMVVKEFDLTGIVCDKGYISYKNTRQWRVEGLGFDS